MKRIAGVALGLFLAVFVAGGNVGAASTEVGPLEVSTWYQGNASLPGSGVTLIVFWEAWCPHCRTEMPKLNALYREFRSGGLNVVGLTKGTRGVTDAQIRDYIRDKYIRFPIGKEKNGAMSAKLGIRGVPSAIAVENNQIIWRGHPARITEDTIRKWL